MSDSRTVTALQAKKSLLKAFQVKRPLFLWGPPGIGKSELVEGIANELGGLMIDLRLGQMEPTDIRGIPYYNKDKGVMDWAPPVELQLSPQTGAHLLRLWCKVSQDTVAGT